MDYELLKAARERLHTHAHVAIRKTGLSRWEWETDPEVIEFAKTHGIEQEIEHIGSVACGYRR